MSTLRKMVEQRQREQVQKRRLFMTVAALAGSAAVVGGIALGMQRAERGQRAPLSGQPSLAGHPAIHLAGFAAPDEGGVDRQLVQQIKEWVTENTGEPDTIEWIKFETRGIYRWFGSEPFRGQRIDAKWRARNVFGAIQVFNEAFLFDNGRLAVAKADTSYRKMMPDSDFDEKGIHKDLRALERMEMPKLDGGRAPAPGKQRAVFPAANR